MVKRKVVWEGLMSPVPRISVGVVCIVMTWVFSILKKIRFTFGIAFFFWYFVLASGCTSQHEHIDPRLFLLGKCNC